MVVEDPVLAEALDHELEPGKRQVERGQVEILVVELIITTVRDAEPHDGVSAQENLAVGFGGDVLLPVEILDRCHASLVPSVVFQGKAVGDLKVARGGFVGRNRLEVGIGEIGHARPRVGLDRPGGNAPPPVEQPLLEDRVDVAIGIVAIVGARATPGRQHGDRKSQERSGKSRRDPVCLSPTFVGRHRHQAPTSNNSPGDRRLRLTRL